MSFSPRATLLLLLVGLPCLIRAHETTRPHVLLAQAAPPLATAAHGTVPLVIEIVLADSDQLLPGLVRITSAHDGRAIDLPAHLRRPMGWYSLAAGATVHVPAVELKIVACHGLDTEIATITHAVRPGGTAPDRVRVPLHRFYDPKARRMAAANTHLHLQLNAPRAMGGAWLRSRAQAEEYLQAVGQSDALDLVYVSHLERVGENQNYISNEFRPADLARFSNDRLRFVYGEEHRHEGGRSTRRGGSDELRYGHVLFLDLPRLVEPVSYGAVFMPGRAPSDAVPMRRAIAEARGLGATVVWCHGRQGTEDVPSWVAGLLHAQNIYDGGNDGTVETLFYPYLNAGFRVPFSTGTDWGSYDFSRVYVPTEGTVSSGAFLQNLAAGRSFITNGTFLEFEVDGKAPGDTLELSSVPHIVTVRGRAIGRDDFGHLEIIRNGEIDGRTVSRRVGNHFEAELEVLVEIREPGWLALRIPTTRPYNDRSSYSGAGANLFGKALFAHTSPVYVPVAGRSIREPAAIRALIADLEASVRTIEAKGAFASDAERAELLAVYREALAALHARLP